MTRHGRRHKFVRDRSRRVWEATRRVFSGMTRVSMTHRSRYENGDEWAGQNVQPSVVCGRCRSPQNIRPGFDESIDIPNALSQTTTKTATPTSPRESPMLFEATRKSSDTFKAKSNQMLGRLPGLVRLGSHSPKVFTRIHSFPSFHSFHIWVFCQKERKQSESNCQSKLSPFSPFRTKDRMPP